MKRVTFEMMFTAKEILGNFRSNKLSNCFVCKELTNWINLSYEVHLCSLTCERKLDESARENLKNSSESNK